MNVILKISDGGSKQKLNMDGLEGLDWILFGNLALLEHLAVQIKLILMFLPGYILRVEIFKLSRAIY